MKSFYQYITEESAIANALLDRSTITSEMVNHYHERLDKHIAFTQDALKVVQQAHPDWKLVFEHDYSKKEEPELTPYIWITWNYLQKDLKKDFKYPEGVEATTRAATFHHITTNRHHPEYWAPYFKDNIDPNDRDKAVAAVVVTRMPDEAVGEMVADWVAMGRERGNTARAWYDKVNGKRFTFSEHQKKLIDGLLKLFEQGY